jgi:hypothetical protein
MRCLVTAVLFLSLAGLVFGQGHQGQFWSPGGFGSVLYPATGHAPQTPPGGFNGPHYGRSVFGNPGFASHPQHGGGTVIVPYPVYYGGYYGYDPSAGYGPGYGDQAPAVNSNAVPSVVINQTFVPQQANPVVREYTGDQPSDQQQSGLKLYQAPPSHPYADATAQQAQRSANSDQPTLYLIAFRDHTIVQALGYWMEGPTLHYVSVEHTLNQVSIDLIDRDLSQRLNDERGVEFKLSPVR